MDIVALEPPYDWTLLDAIAAEALTTNGRYVANTVAWLRRHPSEEQQTEAVRRAWQATPFALHAWAPAIERVELLAQSDGGDLVLHVVGADLPHAITQQAPFDDAFLDEAAQRLGGPLPSAVRHLARAAPGLSLDRRGALLRPTHLWESLGLVRRCARHWAEPRPKRAMLQTPEPRLAMYLMEVAEEPQGHAFLVDRAHAVWFFDHLEPTLTPCTVALDDFVAGYLADPDCLYDSDWLGFDQRRAVEVDLSDRAFVAWANGVERAWALLSNGARLACMARALERSDLRPLLARGDQEERAELQRLSALFAMIRTFAQTGAPLAEERVRAWLSDVEAFVHAAWARSFREEGYDLAQLVPPLRTALLACAQDGAALHKLRNALWDLAAPCTPCDIDRHRASLTSDLAALKAIDNAPPNSDGESIPAAFFERPLWAAPPRA